MSARYAIYFSPEIQSPWWAFGATWLGRDEKSGHALPQPLLAGLAAGELQRITIEPRRYGFHATLKAPFRLAEGHDETELINRMQSLAATLSPLPLGLLNIVKLGNFMALVPDAAPVRLESLASACVLELDDLRARLSKEDMDKRQPKNLDARGRELLALYGYPYVMERFRFHMTLTGPLTPRETQTVTHSVAVSVSMLNKNSPLLLDRLCLFVEEAPGTPFRRITDITLGQP